MEQPQAIRNRRILQKGEALIVQGETSRDIFLLEKGILHVCINGRQVDCIDASQSQEFVGEIAAILNLPRTASVVAATECTILCIPKVEIETVIAKSPALGVRLINSLCKKLAHSSSAFARLESASSRVAGSGGTGVSLRNYMSGLLHVIESTCQTPTPEALDRLHKYFLFTNPWGIQEGKADCVIHEAPAANAEPPAAAPDATPTNPGQATATPPPD